MCSTGRPFRRQRSGNVEKKVCYRFGFPVNFIWHLTFDMFAWFQLTEWSQFIKALCHFHRPQECKMKWSNYCHSTWTAIIGFTQTFDSNQNQQHSNHSVSLMSRLKIPTALQIFTELSFSIPSIADVIVEFSPVGLLTITNLLSTDAANRLRIIVPA